MWHSAQCSSFESWNGTFARSWTSECVTALYNNPHRKWTIPTQLYSAHLRKLFTNLLMTVMDIQQTWGGRQSITLIYFQQRPSGLVSAYWRQRWWFLVLWSFANRPVKRLKKPTYIIVIAIAIAIAIYNCNCHLQSKTFLQLLNLFSPIICFTKLFLSTFRISKSHDWQLWLKKYHDVLWCLGEPRVNQKLHIT